MSKIKKILKKIIGKKSIAKIKYCKRLKNVDEDNKYKKLKTLFFSFYKIQIFDEKTKGKSFKKLFSKLKVQAIDENAKFYYYIDIYKNNLVTNKVLDNFSVDYSVILNNSLSDLKKYINISNEDFYNNEIDTIQGIEIYLNNIIKKVNSGIADNLENIKNSKSCTFYESLQRILFFNSLLWQSNFNRKLNGLGRLDLILYPYYNNDIKNGVLTDVEARNLLKEFLKELHKFYEFKSADLYGDTGQIIELGGNNIKGDYEYNDLTLLFIELIEELQYPDPKLLLRVSKKTPRIIIEKALKCIKTGIGCPLFANDDVIIEKLINFGYDKECSYNYGTSACWEPYIIGNSSAQNNVKNIVMLKPLEKLFNNEDLNKILNFEQLIIIYKKYLKEEVNEVIDIINKMSYEEDPFLSLFFIDCLKSGKDISKGGAKYNDIGILTVGFANLINSLFNIKQMVYETKEISLEELNIERKNNFNNNQNLIKKLKSQVKKFGTDNKEVIELSNDILKYISSLLKDKKTFLNGKFKFGLSSPSYITLSKNFPASLDGRRKGEPFSVHISSDSSNSYSELINFASQLSYDENRFNGNVVDFFVSPSFIEDNFDKFVDFLMLSINIGFFEMQMNVVSSQKLIEARNNPEKFPNLIVRVWGFSAYFNDLPDNYKEYLIERAKQNEND